MKKKSKEDHLCDRGYRFDTDRRIFPDAAFQTEKSAG